MCFDEEDLKLLRPLCFALRAKLETQSGVTICNSIKMIAKVCGVPCHVVKRLLRSSEFVENITCKSRACKKRKLTEEQEAFLVSEETLRKWLPFSLQTRAKLFELRFPGSRLPVTRLRLLYKKHKIKHRVIG
jgi:hypothetical protein